MGKISAILVDGPTVVNLRGFDNHFILVTIFPLKDRLVYCRAACRISDKKPVF